MFCVLGHEVCCFKLGETAPSWVPAHRTSRAKTIFLASGREISGLGGMTMNLSDARPMPTEGTSCMGVLDRRQSERSTSTKPVIYVFNEAHGEALTIHTGPGLMHDVSTGGMCVQVEGKPPDHGILEVRTVGPGDTGWVWLLGITWTREVPGPKRPASLVGGRLFFGCCMN